MTYSKNNTTTITLSGKPSDYNFTRDDEGRVIATKKSTNNITVIDNAAEIQFDWSDSKIFNTNTLLANKFLTNRRDISIYGDTELNRMVVMKLSSMEMIQEIKIAGEKVYSADYVTAEKSYITPRGSNFTQLLYRNFDGRFVVGDKIDLPFAPRTPNRNRNTGLVLFSGADKPMYALIDSNNDTLIATGGRDEITFGIDNFDSKWSTGHAQWVSEELFILPDRETYELTLYRVTKAKNTWDVKKVSSVTAPSSVHTFFGTTIEENGNIKVFTPGEGHNESDNTDANLYELTISGDTISISRQVNVSGGLHHPGIHPNKKIIYAPTSNGQIHIIDKESFEITKTIEAGKDAGHVVFIENRNLALIVNHNATFMTAIDITTHDVIKNIEVTDFNPDVDEKKTSLQAHTGRVSPDHKYFYNFASNGGTFFRVNLDTLEVDETVYTGGTPKQASQPGELGSDQ